MMPCSFEQVYASLEKHLLFLTHGDVSILFMRTLTVDLEFTLGTRKLLRYWMHIC